MTNEPRAGNGLDPEMLAAYIDKRLPPDERAVVEAKLAADPESYELLVELIHANEALKDQLPADTEAKEGAERDEPQARTGAVVPLVPKPKRTRGWAIAGGVLAAAAAVVLVVRLQPELWQRIRGGEPVDPLMANLVAAVSEQRYVEGRLSGGFKYAPLQQATRGSSDLTHQNLPLLAAAGELQKLAQAQASAENKRVFAMALLQLGRYDEAIQLFSEADVLAANNALYQNDLAVAYLARARRDGRTDDWSKAVAAADRAITLDANLLEPWFNRALALEGMGLSREARAAWQDYLGRDRDSGWAEEARKALERTRDVSLLWEEQLQRVAAGAAIESLVDVSVQDAREHVERVLILEWAERLRNREEGATVALGRARQLASRLAASGADDLALQEVGFLEGLSGRAQEDAAEAHWQFQSALRELDRFEFVKGTQDVQRALLLFERLHSPMALRAKVVLASAHRTLRDIATATSILATLPTPATSRCSVAVAERDRVLGLAKLSEGDFGAALGHYASGLNRYQACGEVSSVAALHALSAETLSALGLFEQAWEHQHAALEAFDGVRDPRIQMQIMFCAGRLALQEGLPETALYFKRAFVAITERTGNTPAYAEAKVNVAKVLLQLGRRAEADSEIAAARAALGDSGDPAHRRFVSGELALALASAEVEGVDSGSELSSAIAHAQNANRPEILPSLLLARSRRHQVAGHIDDARSDLRAGVDVFRKQLRLSSDAWSRWSFRASGWLLYQELADLELKRGNDPERALETLYEGNRAVFGRSSDNLAFRRFQERLPDKVGVLFLSVSADAVSTWLVTRQAIGHHSLGLDRAQFLGLAARFNYAVVASTGHADAVARQLDELLIAPFATSISGLESLAIVSPGAAGQLPWAGLRDRSGRYLIERVLLRIAESDLTFRPPFTLAADTPIALLAAASSGPSGDDLERLRLVQGGVRQIAAMYSENSVLDGSLIEVAHAVDALRTHKVFHFAGHAFSNDENPDQSALLLKKTDDAVVALTARTLSEARITLDLAVLTACRTAVDLTPRSAGRASLASVLLRAGARAVVATLGDVPDDVAHDVGIRLHERLLAGDHLDLALRNVQLEAVGQDGFWHRTLFATFY